MCIIHQVLAGAGSEAWCVMLLQCFLYAAMFAAQLCVSHTALHA
jgi:hypothetical protein